MFKEDPFESAELTRFMMWRTIGTLESININFMFSRFFFNRMSLVNKVSHLKKKGVMLGSRLKDGRRMYIYMFSELFIEVLFKNDNQSNEPEKLTILKGLDNLNQYLENDFKGTSF